LPPQDLHFLVVVASLAGNHHQKGIILGGLTALQTSLRRRQGITLGGLVALPAKICGHLLVKIVWKNA
jgi:hypothetical protein